ncbi:P-loop-containing nucleoside triphosphate hydrolase [Chloropicon primus]|uniref:P-loop-containing nucleoside triphosphate hydrolase n=2 Tax=Chloropicon primus TaxID=1764295 RepID=A0A5B8MRQ7_9CHLO|nr:P-loop-containing nucleoside triphosphate hydrolase [Chloropicon primus]UPR02620.1 P-loop-containing nucleoside triphosphate hydrolase [Chloropicon primus]|eukprot:QDZ23408.1 P-loop-containing nucleoside triphosphate hydrolase [Chloropicon primus]
MERLRLTRAASLLRRSAVPVQGRGLCARFGPFPRHRCWRRNYALRIGSEVGDAAGGHRSVKEWVVFSDLHVSRQTQDTCMDVLNFVNVLAKGRGAGVIFLGDFFHLRGSLPVEPLNKVLKLFAEDWKQPTVMIPGNHDQVDRGGVVHSLEPIAKACSNVIVIDKPSYFMGALWLPYRQRKEEIEEELMKVSPNDGGGSGGGGKQPKAIFCHVDIIGADFNEQFQSAQGIHPSAFPSTIPVYTGHYHRPHSIEGRIHYVGSQYQVSFGESNQRKSVKILDGSDWSIKGDVEVDLGPRHFTFDASATALHDATIFDAVRAGDRVRVKNVREEETERLSEALRGLGVSSLDLQPRVEKETVRIENADDMNADGIFQAYADHSSLSPETRSLCQSIMAEMEAQNMETRSSDIRLRSVELQGYGPFRDRVCYDIEGPPNLRIISGENVDSDGATSNGAGKTSLLMAAIWALTGKTELKGDPSRKKRSLTNRDVVNDSSKVATVVLRGSLNNEEFEIERSITPRSLKNLSFRLGGVSKTQLDSKATQASIDEAINTNVLCEMMMIDAENINSLLFSTDKKLKEQFALIAPSLSHWEEASKQAKGKLREAKDKFSSAASEEEICKRVLTHSEKHLENLESQVESWTNFQASKILELERQLEDQEEALVSKQPNASGSSSASLVDEIEQLRGKISEAEDAVRAGEEQLSFGRGERINKEKDLSLASYEVATLQETLKKKEALLRTEQHGVCPTCDQPIDATSFAEHLSELAGDLGDKMQRQQTLQEELQGLVSAEREMQTSIRGEKASLTRLQNELAGKAASALQDQHHHNELQALREQAKVLRRQENPYRGQSAEAALKVQSEKEALEQRERAVAELRKSVETLKSVDAAFSTTGVQSYVIEGALKQLQGRTNKNLEILSSNSLQLQLNSTRTTKQEKQIESIEKKVLVRNASGKFVERSLSQLSGGERGRLGLALALGFSSLASLRSGIRSNLMVLDEVMHSLDDEGVKRLIELLSGLSSTVLLVAQPHTAAYDMVDAKDVVRKEKDTASLEKMY